MSETPEVPTPWQPAPDDLLAFQTHLKELLDRRDISQNRIESLAGFSRGTLSKIFVGKLHISRRHTIALAAALEMSEGDLLSKTALEPLLGVAMETPESEALAAAHKRINQLEQEAALARMDLVTAQKGAAACERDLAAAREEVVALREALSAARVALRHTQGEAKQADATVKKLSTELGGARGQVVDLEKEVKVLQAGAQHAAQERRALVLAQRKLEEAVRERDSSKLLAEAAQNRAEREHVLAEQAKRQAEEWAKQAADQTSRANQLQQLVWQIQEQARAKVATASTQLSAAKAAADSAVSPGSALLLALAGAGLGYALTSPPKRR
jgi:hypothetical protein